MDTRYFNKIKSAITTAEKDGLSVELDGLTGYSGKKMVGCLQRLAQLNVNENQCYLEVGVYQGMTLLSVAGAIDGKFDAFGIDNFAFFDKEGKNFGIVKQRIENLKLHNAKVINLDYEDALHNLKDHLGGKKIGVYFIDGPHDYRSQLVCLLFAKPFLADNAIIIIDDSNYRHVRQANADFLKGHPEFKLVFEAYTHCHPQNMTDTQIDEARDGWWDGINIIVRDKNNMLSPMFPQTFRNRGVYENEHQTHSNRFPESAVQGGYLAEAFYQKKWIKVLKQNYVFLKKFGKKSANTPDYPFSNTYSNNLPKAKFNDSLK